MQLYATYSIEAIRNTPLVAGAYWGRPLAGSSGTAMRIAYLEYWKKKPYLFNNY
jgi:hypothetical protein